MTLKLLLETERTNLNHFLDNVNVDALQELHDLLFDCSGLIILTGVGKSGLIAEKISLTLSSTGSRALYISPTNALHGDIGVVSAPDIFIMLSKSGESDELLNLVPYLRNKNVKIIAIVCNGKSRLAKAVDFVLELPLEPELCPFDLAPTTSTVMQMIVGDVLAVGLMHSKQFSKDQFAANHPAGRIGRRIATRVKDLMIKGEGVPLAHPNDKLVDTLVELSNKRCGCVLISDASQKLLGIFTDGDLRRALQNKGSIALESKMVDLMTKAPRSIHAQVLAWDALHQMEADQKRPITVLAVLDDEEKIVGLIKMHDIIQAGL